MRKRNNGKMGRAVCLLLAGMLALSFVSCAKDEPEKKTEPSSSVSTEEQETVEQPPVTGADYGGEEFNVLYLDWSMYQTYYFSDGLNKEVMNDTIYERNRQVEDYLGVKMTSTPMAVDDNKLFNSALAGDKEYSLVLAHCYIDIFKMANENILYDLYDLPEINMDDGHWNKYIVDTMEYQGHAFYGANDYLLADPNAVLFNKSMAESRNLESLYDLTANGQWTLEKMFTISTEFSQDLDGNGKYDENDIYGFAGESAWTFTGFLQASDIYIISRDSEGDMKLSISGERTLNLMDQIYALGKAKSTYLYPYGCETSKKMPITSDHCLFAIDSLSNLALAKGTSVRIGILPYPKLDESQETYTSLNWNGFFCVPGQLKNEEMTGKTIEMLGYLSATSTVPAYYEVLLGCKMAEAKEDTEMLDLIFGHVVTDFGFAYCTLDQRLDNLAYSVSRYGLIRGASAFTKQYAASAKGIQQVIDDKINS